MGASLHIHHLAIKAKDLTQLRTFYEGVLGLAVTKENFLKDGTLRSVWFDLGSSILMLEQSEKPERHKMTDSFFDDPPGLHVLSLGISVSERDSWRSKLADLGIMVGYETKYTLYLRDPEGNRIGLTHYPEESLSK